MLKGRVAVITGGTRGIGLETVRLFKEQNAEVVLFGSKAESVEKAVEQLKSEGMEVKGYYPNLNNIDEINNVLEEIKKALNYIPIWTCNGNTLKTIKENTILPEKNEPCLCGSGKKFKHCCWKQYK